MKPFDTLTKRGQWQRLRQVGLSALAAYDVPEPLLTPIHHIENSTFRVLAADHQQYVLRIQRADSHSPEAIRSEMQWLTALHQETALQTPEPVYTRAGSPLVIIEAPGMPGPRTCVLFRWLAGRFFDKTLTPQHLEPIGMFMAQLHEHTARWQLPTDFVRGRVAAITEAARRTLWQPAAQTASPTSLQPGDEDVSRIVALVHDLFSSADAALVARTLAQIRRVFGALGEGGEVFGLIHADLHQANYLFQCGIPCAIDFDDCGWGHYLYDLSVTLSELTHLPTYPRLRETLLRGYRTIRPLPAHQEAYLETFFALRRIQLMSWVIESREHPAFRDGWVRWARNDLEELAKFLAHM
ncbi:MAG: homoserine kinase [Caldilinea sp. CFX5]|nr:homoserine kinase [Caldilinea sp. CFX5]